MVTDGEFRCTRSLAHRNAGALDHILVILAYAQEEVPGRYALQGRLHLGQDCNWTDSLCINLAMHLQ